MTGDGVDRPGVDWRSAYLALEEQVEAMLLAMGARGPVPEPIPATSAAPVTLRAVEVGVHVNGLRAVAVADGTDLEYAFVVTRGGSEVMTTPFGRSNTVHVPLREPGIYRVKATVRPARDHGAAVSRTTGPTNVSGS